MGGWLVQVPVKRFGTETMVHLYAVWLPDRTDALIHARVDAAKVATVSKAGSGERRKRVDRVLDAA
jgi:hypothetical protein